MSRAAYTGTLLHPPQPPLLLLTPQSPRAAVARPLPCPQPELPPHSPVVRGKAHANDVPVDVDDVIQGVEELI